MPVFGLNENARPASAPAATSHARLAFSTAFTEASCAAIHAAIAYQAGYGMLNDANWPWKKGMKTAYDSAASADSATGATRSARRKVSITASALTPASTMRIGITDTPKVSNSHAFR